MQQKQKGFVPVMLTPFDRQGQVDPEALQRLTEFYIDSGASSLFTNCLSGEMYELNAEERIQLTSRVVKFAAGRVPVVATGNFPGSPAQQVDFIQQLSDTGVEAVILTTSMLVKADEEDAVMRDRVMNILAATGSIKFGFYECPDPYKRLLPAALLGEFVNTGRVIYHKDTSLDINNIREKLSQVNSNAFGLYDAYIVHAVESLEAGSAGLSCIQGNYFPELIVWICDNYSNAGKKEELNMVMTALRNNMDRMHNFYPASAKYFLQKRGLKIETFTRKRPTNFDSDAMAQMDLLFDELNKVCEVLELELVSD